MTLCCVVSRLTLLPLPAQGLINVTPLLLRRHTGNHMWEISFERLLMALTVSVDKFNGHQTVEWSTEEDGQGINRGINALQAIVLR